MADIQHALIQDPMIHEPKGAATANNGTVYVANGTGSGVWTPTNDFPVRTGWASYEDAQYTSLSPLAVTSGVRTKLTIDALKATTETSYRPKASQLWNTGTNKITPYTVGDCYQLRLRFKAKPSTIDKIITLELDVGGALGVILSHTQRFTKGTAEQDMVLDVSTYALSTFVSNGGSIYITTTTDADVYDIGLFITRTHGED